MSNRVVNKPDKIIVSLFWKFCETVGSQGISFFITLVLARLVTPKEYGLVSLVSVFISIATVFVQGGFNTALIQKANTTEKDYSSVCYFSIGVAVVLYSVLFLTSPLLATFYNEKSLVNIIRILALSLLFGAYNSIQIAYCTSNFQFKKIFVATFCASLISGLIGIVVAMNKGGIWALVIQTVLREILVSIFFLFISEWKIKLFFSFKNVRLLIPYGSRILIANLLIVGFQNIRSLLIGKKYDSESLAFYNRGNSFPLVIMSTISTTIQSVLLPAYSEIQHNKKLIKDTVRLSVRMSCYLIYPCMFGLFAISDNLIVFLLTEKWIESSIYLKILCLSYLFFPPQLAPEQAMRAVGLSKVNLNIEICRKICEISLLIISLNYGVQAVAFSAVLASLFGYIIMIYPSWKKLGYTFSEQISDMSLSLFLSLVMVVFIYIVDKILDNCWCGTKLVAEIVIGVLVYLAISHVSGNKEYNKVIRKFVNKVEE